MQESWHNHSPRVLPSHIASVCSPPAHVHASTVFLLLVSASNAPPHTGPLSTARESKGPPPTAARECMVVDLLADDAQVSSSVPIASRQPGPPFRCMFCHSAKALTLHAHLHHNHQHLAQLVPEKMEYWWRVGVGHVLESTVKVCVCVCVRMCECVCVCASVLLPFCFMPFPTVSNYHQQQPHRTSSSSSTTTYNAKLTSHTSSPSPLLKLRS